MKQHERLPVGKRRRLFLILGLLLVTIFLLVSLMILISQRLFMKRTAFENLNKDVEESIEWAIITEHSNLDEEKLLFLHKGNIEQLMENEVDFSFYTADQFLNMVASGVKIDLVTSVYAESQMKRFELSDKVLSVEDLIQEYLPGFWLSEEFYQYFDISGRVHSYPHVNFLNREPVSSFVMLAQKDMMNKYNLSASDFSTREKVTESLKLIRKNEKITPCMIDFLSLQQMFGAKIEDSEGNWQDPYETPETLEALLFMNSLYQERFLPKETFSLTRQQILEKMETGSVFLVSVDRLGDSLSHWRRQELILDQYEAVGPISPEEGSPVRFNENFNGEYASTLFMKDSEFVSSFPKLFLWFYYNNWDFSREQWSVLKSLGMMQELEQFQRVKPAFSESSPIYAYSDKTDRGIPYMMQFSSIADSKLEYIIDSVESYRATQIPKMVMIESEEQLRQMYQETLQYHDTAGYELAEKWYQYKYQKVKGG